MSCITEILKLKGDQDAFVPEGNWIAVEGGGVYKDHEYLIVLNTMGHRCGYVALKPDHPYSQTPSEDRNIAKHKYKHYAYDSLEIECHGGLTFMDPEHGLKQLLKVPCNDMWIGFDCGHYGDLPDKEAYLKYYGEDAYEVHKSFLERHSHYDVQTIKGFHYVEKECHSIIDQLLKAA